MSIRKRHEISPKLFFFNHRAIFKVNLIAVDWGGVAVKVPSEISEIYPKKDTFGQKLHTFSQNVGFEFPLKEMRRLPPDMKCWQCKSDVPTIISFWLIGIHFKRQQKKNLINSIFKKFHFRRWVRLSH